MRAVVSLVAALLALPSSASARPVAADLAWSVSAERRLDVRGTLPSRTDRKVALAVRVDDRNVQVGHFTPVRGRREFALSRTMPQHARQVRFRVRTAGRTGRQRYLGPWRTLRLDALPAAPQSVSVLSPSEVLEAPASGAAGTLVTRTPVAAEQIVAVGRTAATPNGLLGRVSAVSTNAEGQTVAQLVPATLPEAVPLGGFAVTLTSNDLGTVGRRQGARSRLPAPEATYGGKTFESGPVQCHAAVAAPGLNQPGVVPALATVKGTLDGSLDIGASWHWGLPPKASAHAIFKPALKTEVRLDAGEAISCELEPQSLTRGKVPLGIVTVPVGPVPLVISLQGEVLLTGTVRGTAGLTAGATARLEGAAGLRLNEGGKPLQLVGDLSPSFTPTLPRVSVEGNGEIGVRAQLTALVDGVAGPALDVTPALKLEGGPTHEPLWTLSAPVTGGAQWKADLFGLGILETESPRYQVFEHEFELANSEAGALFGGRMCDSPAISRFVYKGYPVSFIVKRLEVSGVTCGAALKQAGLALFGYRELNGWTCAQVSEGSSPFRCSRDDSAWFTFVSGGGTE